MPVQVQGEVALAPAGAEVTTRVALIITLKLAAKIAAASSDLENVIASDRTINIYPQARGSAPPVVETIGRTDVEV